MNRIVKLPPPLHASNISVEYALLHRRSVRAYAPRPLPLADLAQLLWAAQGVTDSDGHRTAPSAGALYPLKLSIAAGRVEGLQAGIYHYVPHRHALVFVAIGDRRLALSAAALGQTWVSDAPATLAIIADYSPTLAKYGERGAQYVHMEVGAVAQNVYLQAEALGLGTVFVGAFDDFEAASVLNLSASQHPLGLMPVGVWQKTLT